MATPCTNNPDEVISKVLSAKANADKFDLFVNGSDMQTVQLGVGLPTPTIRNAVRQIMADASWAKQFIANAPEGDVSLNNATSMGTFTERALAERFSDVKNIKDFGAVGNGVHDDTDAVNAALSGGGCVYAPAGEYLLTGTLSIPSDTYLLGAGIRKTVFKSRNADPKDRGIANEHSLLRDATATSGSDSSHWGNNAVYDTNIYLANFTLDMAWHSRFEYTSTNVGIGGPSGIEFGGVAYATVKRIEVLNAGTNAFNTKAFYKANNLDVFSSFDEVQGRSHHILFEDCMATGCWRDDGFTTHLSDDITIRNCHGVFTPLDSTLQHSSHHSSHAVEVDCGSRRVVVDCCSSHGLSSCCGIVAHADELPCEDVHVSNCVCSNGDDPFSVWKDVDSGEQKQNRNVTFTNCVVDGLASHTANDDSGPRTSATFFNVLRAKNIKIENYKILNGISSDSALVETKFVLNRGINVIVDGLGFVDVATPEGQTTGKISLISSSVSFKNIFTNSESNNSILIDSYDSIIGCIDTLSSDGSTNLLYLMRTTYPTDRWTSIDIRNIDCQYQIKVFNSSGNEILIRRNAYENIRIGNDAVVGSLSFSGVDREDVQVCLHYNTPPYPQIGIDDISQNIYIGGFDSSSDTWKLSNWFVPSTGRFNPHEDGIASLGMNGHKWSQLYASTSTISTSDFRLKTNISEPSDAVFRAWGNVKIKLYQLRDAVEKKGNNARIHAGVIAQEIKDAFEAEGLDAGNYGLFCFDKWNDEYADVPVVDVPAIYDENGNLKKEAVTHTEKILLTKAGEQYSIRYAEALALECAYQRWLGEKRDARIAELEARLNKLSGNSTAPSGASPDNL